MKTPLFVRQQPGGLYSVIDQNITTGNIFFVDSGSATGADAVGYGENPDSPCVTIDYAIGLCTASNGDIIYVMPGHAETLSTADDVLCDVAGVKIIGIGWGGTMPTISVDTEHTEEAGWNITADNVWIENIKFLGINAGGSKNAIAITAADYTTIKGCVFAETSTDKELAIGAAYGVITLLDATGAIVGTQIINCTMIGKAGHDESFISVTDGSLGATEVLIDGCVILGTFADDLLQADVGTNVNTQWVVKNSILGNLGGNNIVMTIDTGAVFYLSRLNIIGAHTTTAPIVGYNASYMTDVNSCEPGAYGSNAVIGSVTNWGA